MVSGTPHITKPVIRVTELSTWQECHYKYHLSASGLRLRPQESSGLSPQMSGTAIHFGIEAGLLAASGRDKATVAHAAANVYLDRFGADRYRAGVHTAIDGITPEIWATQEPQAEQRIFMEYDTFILTGKPDLWTYSADAIDIIDFKSTSKDEQDRLDKMQLFNMQPRYYGVLLTAWLVVQGREAPPVYTRHIVLSTRGKHVYGAPHLVTDSMWRVAQAMILKIGHAIVAQQAVTFVDATIGSHCVWCEFQDICVGHLTGADTASIMSEKYKRGELMQKEFETQ